MVTIVPQNPPHDLRELLAGPESRLRVRAQVSGALAPATPSWTWEVSFGQVSPVSPTEVGSADVIEFPLRSPGAYYIRAQAAPGCTGEITATAASASDRILNFWVRITPPRASGLPPQDNMIVVGGRNTPAKIIALLRGQLVRIDPHDRNNNAIDSYIRVSSSQSTVRFEGHNKDSNAGFFPSLLPLLSYDVLVVPDGGIAPALIRNLRPTELVGSLFTLDAGIPVSGDIRAGAGAGTPVAGARVLLRAGGLPSTIGASDAAGAYELRARTGTWSGVVLPPAGSALPEANVEGGIAVGAAATNLRFQWRALPSARLDVAITEPTGVASTRAVRVRIEAEPGALPDVGSFQVGGGPPLPASGFLRLETLTGAGGIASFASVPAGRYRAFAMPPDYAPDVTMSTARIEAGAAQAQRIALARPVALTGRVSPAALARGLRVVALDADLNSPVESVSSTVDEAGQFGMLVAPGRSYRVQIEPAQERKLPRLFLGAITVGGDTTLGTINIAEGVTFLGTVTVEQTVVPGSVIQVYCTGLPPDCVDPAAPQADAARPVGETVTDASGRFQIHLPDPASWHL